MTKRLLAALLCAILVMALLPATALAKTYNSWDDAIASPSPLAVGDTITIGENTYTYKGNLSTATTMIDLSGCTEHTVFKAGSGKVLWVPEKKDGAVADGTLTLNNAEITMSISGVSAFKLPSNPTIVLLGENIISGDRTYAFKGDDKFGTITITGSGTIDTTNGCTLISVGGGAIKLIDGERWGTMSANVSVELNNVTIPENRELHLEQAASVTKGTTGSVNNGKLVLNSVGTEAENKTAIDKLDLTGDGYVMVKGNTDPDLYFTNDGEKIHKYEILDFNTEFYKKDDDTRYFKIDRTHNLNDYGYKIEGDPANGYIITLGNLLIEPKESDGLDTIILPDDGNVTVYLTDGTTTRIKSKSGSGIKCSSQSSIDSYTYTYTITGNGKLEIQSLTQQGAISVDSGLIIAGGDITINNNHESGFGIDAYFGPSDGTDRTVNITGGKLKITTKKAAIAARDRITKGSGIQITSPEGAEIIYYTENAGTDIAFSYYTIVNADSKPATSVVIEPLPIVTSVVVNPASVSIQKGGSQTFNATVLGLNNPAQTVAWTVEGGITGTSISTSGVLTIAANETATSLTVKATSTQDTTKNGTATVTVTTPPATSSGGDYTPAAVTLYNDPQKPKATVWLTGSGLAANDQLITKQNPQGAAFTMMRTVAGKNEVVATYDISLKSGNKSTGSAMSLTFDPGAKYAGQEFTLVHQKADGTLEYFYAVGDANGRLVFSGVYSLSPFMLVKGRLAQTAYTNLTDAPKTGDSAQTVLLAGAALMAAAALAGPALRKQKRN